MSGLPALQYVPGWSAGALGGAAGPAHLPRLAAAAVAEAVHCALVCKGGQRGHEAGDALHCSLQPVPNHQRMLRILGADVVCGRQRARHCGGQQRRTAAEWGGGAAAQAAAAQQQQQVRRPDPSHLGPRTHARCAGGPALSFQGGLIVELVALAWSPAGISTASLAHPKPTAALEPARGPCSGKCLQLRHAGPNLGPRPLLRKRERSTNRQRTVVLIHESFGKVLGPCRSVLQRRDAGAADLPPHQRCLHFLVLQCMHLMQMHQGNHAGQQLPAQRLSGQHPPTGLHNSKVLVAATQL